MFNASICISLLSRFLWTWYVLREIVGRANVRTILCCCYWTDSASCLAVATLDIYIYCLETRIFAGKILALNYGNGG